MFAQERQTRILEELTRLGRVEVSDLAARYAVSEHTVRRDLKALEERGFLQKTHGGAVALRTAHLDWNARSAALPQAKEQIGRAAAERITAGQSVLLDAGSTTLALAQCLQARPLTVITNSLDIAALFDRDPEVRLIVTGGAWDARARAFRGHAAEQALAGYRADWTVLGTCALHLQAGATVLEEADAALKRAMVAAGLRTLLLADHTKRDQTVPHRVLAPQDLGTVVTDRPWPELAALGVQVVVAAG